MTVTKSTENVSLGHPIASIRSLPWKKKTVHIVEYILRVAAEREDEEKEIKRNRSRSTNYRIIRVIGLGVLLQYGCLLY